MIAVFLFVTSVLIAEVISESLAIVAGISESGMSEANLYYYLSYCSIDIVYSSLAFYFNSRSTPSSSVLVLNL